MKINLYGYGFVGKAHYEVLKNHHEINIIDPMFLELTTADFEPQCAIICVSTPQAEDGACDMTNVFDVVSQIHRSIPILIKSTISLEGWYNLKEQYPHHSINFSPEFLRAETYIDDFKNITTMYLSTEKATMWATLFNPYWKNLQFKIGEAEELILIKYFRNSFLATKVSFFNQVHDMCKAVGVTYEEVASGIAQDSRIGFSHTKVTEERGWGGYCFPKDTSAIIKTAELYNTELGLIKEVRRYNSEIRNEKHSTDS